MARSDQSDEAVILLRHLLAIELWRSGLSQTEIRKRVGLGMNAVNEMLKGVSKEVTVRVRESS